MFGNHTLLVLTDLDGTLLDWNGDWAQAETALIRLRELGAHVVPVTAKSALEVRPLRAAMNLQGAYVVESGSGIYALPPMEGPDLAERAGRDSLLKLARPYIETRRALKELGALLEHELIGFGDMTLRQVASLIGTDASNAMRARARRWSEPFLRPMGVPLEAIRLAARSFGYDVLEGDRMWHLVTLGVDKGAAGAAVIEHYRAYGDPLTVIAIGNSGDDRPLLELADAAFVVPGSFGPHPSLVCEGWVVTEARGAAGWAAAMHGYLDRLA